MVDFDGDCLSDLFMTVVDQSNGKTYYEIFLRREKEQSGIEDDLSSNVTLNSTEPRINITSE